MSVQLILYPQGLIPDNPNEFVVNGINFTNLSSASTYSSSVATTLGTPTALVQNVLTNAFPAIPNFWYRFISTASATPAAPTNVANNAVFNSVGATSGSGIYQKMTNLIPGETYYLNVEFINTASVGSISCVVYDGITLSTQGLQGTQGPNIGFGNSWTQPAGSTTATIVLTYSSAFFQDFTIKTVSVISLQFVSNITTSIEDGQVILDLYEDENIPLTLSVDEFKNVAEQVQSYSKAFNLPATKRNNQIFENLFEVTRSAQNSITFNPYVRSRSILKQDGFILFEGYLRVLDIQDKEGEISYNVNLYSEVVSFADTLKDKTFSQLNFTELEHDYNKTNIKLSWNDSPDPPIAYTNSSTSGFRDGNTTVKYPFVDWNHQMLIAAPGGTPTAGNPQLVNLEQAFRPFINIKYLIDRIFQDTEFTYESAFFNEVDFNRLYMDFNWGAENTPNIVGGTTIQSYYYLGGTNTPSDNFATTSFSVMELSTGIPLLGGNFPDNYNSTTHIITSTVLNETYTVNYAYGIENLDSVSRTVQCQWLYNSTVINLSPVTTIAAGGAFTYSGSFSQIMINIGDTLQVQFKTNAGTANKVRQQLGIPANLGIGGQVQFVESISNVTSNVILQTLRGELGQWEFLKGIMTMFNLISLPDKSNPKNIIIEPYKDIFLPSIVIDSSTGLIVPNFFDDNSTKLDWTNKIDTTEIKLEVLADLNKKTVFKFVEDDDDYAFNLYKTAVQGHLYGSQEFDASYFSGLPSVLEGEEEIEATPFAATVPKPLMSQFPDFITPSIYSYNADDGTSEGFENSPRIMYNNGIKSLALGTFTSCTYYIPEQNGVSSENANAFLQFSHLTDIPTLISIPPDPDDTRDFHFGECQLIQPIGGSTPNNLFSTYWLPYFNELYNPDTRTMTLKVNLTPGDLNTFFFYDTVFIKNRLFRVNKIDYKPNELATVEFILIP
jgi:hypothetical protein